jgi:hypothetical protein
LKSNHHVGRYTFTNEIVPSLQQTYNKIINVNEFSGVLNVLVNTFVGDLNQNQLIGNIQEMASFIAFSLMHLLAFFRSKG